MDIKFLDGFILFILGIFMSVYLDFNYILIFMVSIIVYILYFICLRLRGDDLSLAFLCLLMGLLVTGLKNRQLDSSQFQDRDVELEGIVYRTEADRSYIRTWEIDGRKFRRNIRVSSDQALEDGDRIRVRVNFKEPKSRRNKNLFNNSLYLKTENLYFSTYLKEGDLISREVSKDFFIDIRKAFEKHVKRSFSGLREENRQIISGMILGDYRQLEEEELLKFRSLGLSHILSVSGLHIGIIFIFIYRLFKFIGLGKNSSYIFSLLIIWIYAFLIYFKIPVLRANIVISIYILAYFLREKALGLKSLLWASIFILLYNPFNLFSMSFILSFMSVFSIYILKDRINSIINLRSSKIIEGLSLLIALEIGLFPIQVYYFNEILVLNIVANLILVPIYSLIIIVAFLVLVLASFFRPLILILSKSIEILFFLAFKFMDLLLSLDFTKLTLSSPKPIEILGYYLLVLMILKINSLNKLSLQIKKYLCFSLIFFMIVTSLDFLLIDRVLIDFIDVNQGDSILIRTREGNYLIDTGGERIGDFSIAKNITYPYLVKIGARKLDGIFISHFHLDHSKDIRYLMDNLRVGNLYIGYEDSENPIFKSIEDMDYEVLSKGDRLKVSRDKEFRILSPSKTMELEAYGDNNMSMVKIFQFKDKKILFTGDIELEVEKALEPEKVDIIKVPHHGSKTSSSLKFLRKFSPDYAVCQSAKSKNFPNSEVKRRYEELSIDFYGTARDGNIQFELRPSSIKVRTQLKTEKEKFESGLIAIIFMVLYIILALTILTCEMKYLRREDYNFELHRFKQGYKK